jgi:hypothetical protein
LNGWRQRIQLTRRLGAGGVADVVRSATELARLKRLLRTQGLRGAIPDREYADLFGADTHEQVSSEFAVLMLLTVPPEVARRETRIVRIAGKRVGATCLPQSIVLARRLKQRGFRPFVRIGIAELPLQGMSAHAWVEVAGEPVGEDASMFMAFASEEFARALGNLGVAS